MKRSHICLAMIFATGVAAFVAPVLDLAWLSPLLNWGIASAILVVLAIAAFFFEFEEAAVSSKEIAYRGLWSVP